MMEQIWWRPNFIALGNAISSLRQAIQYWENNRNEYVRDACIQRFEFVIELYWKILKKILAYEGMEANGPKDVMRKAYQLKTIGDEQIWLDILEDRNITSHLYSQEETDEVFKHIQHYLPLLEATYSHIKGQYGL